MTGISEWKEIVGRLRSDKVKERAEAMVAFRTFLSSNRRYKGVCDDGSHSWLETLQSIFDLVVTERNIISAKPTPAAQKRLEEATTLLKWTVEKVHLFLSKRGVKAVINHLTQILAKFGTNRSYSLTYLRTLRFLLTYPPHLEHLDEDHWCDVVSLCLAGVLGDKILIGKAFVDSESMDIDPDALKQLGSLRITEEDDRPPVVQKSTSQSEIELVTCLETTFRSKSSPFVNYSQIIFRKLLRFFEKFPKETTAHLPAITALNRVLAELYLNDQSRMKEFGPRLFPFVFAVWTTKNSSLKEQIVISARYLLPYLIDAASDDSEEPTRVKAEKLLGDLYSTIRTEIPTRWRDACELNLDHLILGLDPNETRSVEAQPFEFPTFRIGAGFSEKDALAWVALEVAADTLGALHVLSEKVKRRSPEEDGSSSNKRVKVEKPVTALLDSLIDEETPTVSKVFSLQLLLFFIERQWTTLHSTTQDQISQAVISMLTHDNLQVQTWTFVAVAALARLEDQDRVSSSSNSKGKQKAGVDWNQVWIHAIRRSSNPFVCRVACHTANVLLAFDRIEPSVVTNSVESFIQDLEIQGPNFPSDAVCTLFQWLLGIAANDVRLFQLQVPEKICTWITNGWRPLDGIVRALWIGQDRPSADPLLPTHLVTLIARCCGVTRAPRHQFIPLYPDCPIASMAVDLAETKPMREYIEGHIPSLQDSTPKYSDPAVASANQTREALERRVSSWLEKTLQSLHAVGEAEAETYWASLGAELVRRQLDLATVALVVEALFELNELRPNPLTIRAAVDVVSRVSPLLSLKKWQPSERALILGGFDLIFIPLPTYPLISYPVLINPGAASGLSSDSLAKISRSTSVTSVDLNSFEILLLRKLWVRPPTRALLEEMAASLVQITGGNSTPGSAPPTQATPVMATQRARELELVDNDDGFGEINIGATTSTSSGGAPLSLRAGAACVGICVRGLISDAMAQSEIMEAGRAPKLIDVLLDSDADRSIVLAEHVSNAVRTGIMTLSLSEADDILNYLGGTLLPDYRFARDERFALAALRFLESTAASWILAIDEEASTDFGRHARMLCAWYAGGLLARIVPSWRVRVHFVAFLDTYLTIDPKEAKWDFGETAARDEKDEIVFPTVLVPKLLKDPDFRVRFRAATSSGGLFTYKFQKNLPDTNLFNAIRANLENNVDLFETILTQILVQASIIVASAARRRLPYTYLLDLACATPIHVPLINSLLTRCAHLLGLPDRAALYAPFASSYVFINCNPKFERTKFLASTIHYAVCGYPSLRALRLADFNAAASVLLAFGQADQFQSACDVTGKEPVAARLECLSNTIALALVRMFTPAEGSDVVLIDPVTFVDCIRTFATAAGTGDEDDFQIEKLVTSLSDEILVNLLGLSYDGQWREGLDLQEVSDDPAIVKLVQQILVVDPATTLISQAPPPAFPPHIVSEVISQFGKIYRCFEIPSVLHSMVLQLLARIQRSPFIDEKRRLLVSLSLGIAHAPRVGKNPAILATLCDGLVSLLDQVDLAIFVASILRWSVNSWCNIVGTTSTTSELCGILVRAAHVCRDVQLSFQYDLARNAAQSLGTDLYDALHKLPREGHPFVQNALFLWPSLQQIQPPPSIAQLRGVLLDSFTPVAKFRLVQPLWRQREQVTLLPPQGCILWRLLASITPRGEIEAKDCTSFADLVYDWAGNVETPTLCELVELEALRGVTASISDESELKHSIVTLLLGFAQGSNPELVYAVSETLRITFSATQSSTLVVADNLPSRSSTTFALLSHPSLLRPQRVRARNPDVNLQTLSTNEWTASKHSFDSWVKDFVVLLADSRSDGDSFYAQLPPLLAQSVDLAVAILPQLVHSVLLRGAINKAKEPRQILSSYFESLLAHPDTNEACVRVILDVAVYLRRHLRPGTSKTTGNDCWLAIPWTVLAKAAVRIGSHLSALLFLELAHEHDSLFTAKEEAGPVDVEGQSLLYAIYKEIEEPDGFYGRQSSVVREALIRRYEHEERWSRVFEMFGSDYESDSIGSAGGNAAAGVVNSLASFGFNRLAMSVLQPARSSGEITDQQFAPDLPYNLAWRTETWDLPTDRRAAGSSNVALYSALRAVHTSRDAVGLQAQVEAGIISEVSKLSSVGVDLPTPSQKSLLTILALREISQWSKEDPQHPLSPSFVERMTSVSPQFQFDQAERILSTRISLLRSIQARERAEQIGDEASAFYLEAAKVEAACLLELSSAARRAGKVQSSMNAVTKAQKLAEWGMDVNAVTEEFSHVLWNRQEHGTAISLLKSVNYETPGNRSLVLAQLGSWTAEARLKNSREISEVYFDPAVSLTSKGCSPAEVGRVHGAYAQFADSEYEESFKISKSKRERFERYARQKQLEFVEIERRLQDEKATESLRTQLERGKSQGKAHLEEDERQVLDAEGTTKLMLRRALENYGKALEASDEHDSQVFRFCALWLSPPETDDIHSVILPLLDKIPSRKFVFLAYQLSARLSKSDSPFSKNISKLVLRLSTDHPFHSLFAVHALRDAKVLSAPASSSKRPKRSSIAPGASSRAQAAESIFAKVKKDPKRSVQVGHLELACSAYSEWASVRILDLPAYVSTKGHYKKGSLPILKTMKILTRLKDLTIPVSTVNLPIDPTCEYLAESLPCIKGYATTFELMGGVHLPKVVTCIAMDGKEYKQLLKGEDDIRQDAVMEQTFDLINGLLDRDENTRRRNLRIRTYKVVPLPGQTGLMEFVINSNSLAGILGPAYDKARPKLMPADARPKLTAIEKRLKTGAAELEEKDAIFTKILEQLPPVMRHVFFQKHKLPSLWFNMRLNYSRSVATTSIVGHIVGLGDRHVSNILIDEVNGDLVHIDLGIAFEQGKRLPIPELVPFRLTQNIVDGFGMNGVDGVFRRCAEETLRVLRARSKIVMTVLEVFKHDPLQIWALSTDIAQRVQGNGTDEGVPTTTSLEEAPDDADRALIIVADKLDNKVSIEHAVNQLIQQATDTSNLARIYSGWQPYL